ncbi:hypothetical protein ZWY2020_006326 [Hordeum vulgare]|nr:hypothetical protein ZWY2020_006326 [Hordeum vulgare]
MKRRTTMDPHQEQPAESYKNQGKTNSNISDSYIAVFVIHVKMLKTVALDVSCTDTVDHIKSKIPRLKTINLNVKKSNRVADVKAEIEQRVGILMNNQILMYAGRQLEDNQLLSQCNLRNEQPLHVLVSPVDKLRIFVNVRGERTVSVNVKCWYTVADVKLMIETSEGLPVSTHVLMRTQSGVEVVLAEGRTLQDQSVKNNDILVLQQKVLPQQKVQVFIKTWEGKSLTMSLLMSNTTEEVMKKIGDRLWMKEGVYYLCYRGHILSSGDTLEKHDVQNNSTIDIRLRNSRVVEPKPKNGKGAPRN